MKNNRTITILKYPVIFLVILFALVPFASAHPGNTASDGCHYCRTNCGYWGVPWYTRHCHNGYYTPTYTAPKNNWTCKIGDRTFYSNALASEYWYSQIDSSTKQIYKKLLERETNDNDIAYWHSKFPYNNCSGGSWNSQAIWDEVIKSDEYKELTAKKLESSKAVTSTSTNNSSTQRSGWLAWLEENYVWFLWPGIIIGWLLYSRGGTK